METWIGRTPSLTKDMHELNIGYKKLRFFWNGGDGCFHSLCFWQAVAKCGMQFITPSGLPSCESNPSGFNFKTQFWRWGNNKKPGSGIPAGFFEWI